MILYLMPYALCTLYIAHCTYIPKEPRQFLEKWQNEMREEGQENGQWQFFCLYNAKILKTFSIRIHKSQIHPQKRVPVYAV